MNFRGAACVGMLLCAGAAAFATEPSDKTAGSSPSETYSSSAAPESAPATTLVMMQATPTSSGIRPFSAVGVAVKVGVGGIGFDVAVPLAQHVNLRGGGQFFNYSLSTDSDGIHYNGTLDEKSGDIMLDYFPFHGGFRLSPGVIVYNGVHVNASANVPAGQTFTLDDTQYTSDPTGVNPVHGSADIQFGNKVAPAFTLGWGNMIPRRGGHWSVPFEVGFMYISPPKLVLNLQGTACQTGQGCGNIQTDPDAQQDLRNEQNELNDDLKPLRFYPIVSIGVSYSFGKR